MQDRAAGFRLSPQQQHVWLSQRHDSVNCCQLTIEIDGQLNVETLKAALQKIVARHEILRTTFHLQPGLRIPFQVVADECAPAWHELDLRDMPAAQQDAQLEALRLQEQARPFDFERGPLLRVSLLRLSDAQHYLLLTLSALIADARALANIFDELARLTSATDADQNGVAPLQYADFAEWHNQLLESDEAAPGRAFWQTRQLPTAFVLPLAAPNTARATNHTPEVLLTRLETELSAGIRREAHARGASEEEFLLTCWLGSSPATLRPHPHSSPSSPTGAMTRN